MTRAQPSDITLRVSPFAAAMDDPSASLSEMALTISKALQPELDVVASEVVLDELAANVSSPTRDGVIRYLFADGRFQADRADYHNWRNSCLDHVLQRRRGMPITLAIVAIEVARRVGVTLDGVGMPGHFLVGQTSDRTWFADPFHARTDLSREEAQALYTDLGGGDWHEHYLDPIPDRLIIARVLNNLRAATARRGDRAQFALTMQLRQELPEFIHEFGDAQLAVAVFN